MKKVESFTGLAPKLNGVGNIEYCLWVDVLGRLHVQIIGNDAPGTFTQYLFPVLKYQADRTSSKALGKIEAYNTESKQVEVVEDNNNGAFLKAVLRSLLPDEDKK